MRPQKISRDELLRKCALTFKRYGYHGTTMDALARTCGLTKAAFYHYYRSKESLLRDVLAWTHEGARVALFSIAYDASLPPPERLARIGRRANKLFLQEATGCLMGVVAVDATYMAPVLMAPIRDFFDEWAMAMAHLYHGQLGEEDALIQGRQLVAEYEGAILLARIYDDPAYVERVTHRALQLLTD